MTNQNTPYNNLDPSTILAAVEDLGFVCNGSLVALNSYENRVYQIGIEEAKPLIAKFYRPYRWTDAAIHEEHQFAAELLEQDIPVVAPLKINEIGLHKYQDFRFALFPRQGGRIIELENLEYLEWIGRFIGRLHAVGACKSFQHRLRLDVESYGYNPYRFLIEHGFFPAELKQNFCTIIENILEKISEKFQNVGAINYIRLHGDCYAGNILWNNIGPQIVDLDDCLMGPAVQDIWMLLSGDTPQELELQLDHLLRGYQEFNEFNFRELHLIEALRTLRMIHYSGWLARRWEDPAFPLNFPWFNTPRYWQEQLQYLQQQLTVLDQSPFIG